MPVVRNKAVGPMKRRPKVKRSIFTKIIGQKVHYFLRDAPAAYIYPDGGGGITLDTVNAVGTPPVNMTLGAVTADAITGCVQFGIGFKFRLDDVVNPGEFTSMFDRYRILGVRMKYDLICNNQVNATTNLIGALPEIWSVTDYDDGTPPPDLNTVAQYDGCRRKKLEQTRTATQDVYPKYTKLVYTSGVTGIGYGNGDRKDWLDCSFGNIEHYATKWYITDMPASFGKAPAIRVTFTYALALRDPR